MNIKLWEPAAELYRKMNLKEFAEIRDRIRAVLYASEGRSAAEIGESVDRSERWVQEWVYRYRDEGFDGLWDLPRPGAPPKISQETLLPVVARILAGPRPEDHVTVFTGKDIQAILSSEFKVDYSLSRVYGFLHLWGLSSLLPRPYHEKNDPEVMAAWLREAPRIVRRIKKKHPDKMLQIWFLDEMRFGMKGFLRRVWARTNSRPNAVKQMGFTSAYIFGGANPITGDRLGLVIDGANTEIMNIYLDMLKSHLGDSVHAVIILDGAGYHRSNDLEIPENMTVLELPPYSPQLNPIERLWNWVKNHYLCNRCYRDLEEVLEVGVAAWLKITAVIAQSVCATSWVNLLKLT